MDAPYAASSAAVEKFVVLVKLIHTASALLPGAVFSVLPIVHEYAIHGETYAFVQAVQGTHKVPFEIANAFITKREQRHTFE